LGTLINAILVIAGSLLGLLIRKRLPKRFIDIVFVALGLFTVALGITMAMQGKELLLMVFSLVLGGLLGEWLQIEKRLEAGVNHLKARSKISSKKFTEGLTTAFMLFCVGSLTILGAFEEGLGKPPNLLITKAVMDGFSSIALSAAFGIGVLFSVIPLIIYQGSLTIFAAYLAPLLSDVMINELSAVGGVMIVGVGFTILEIKALPIINLLPALIISPLLVWFFA